MRSTESVDPTIAPMSPYQAEDETEIVGGHRNTSDEFQPVVSCQIYHLFKVTDTPFRVAASEIPVEGFIAPGSMDAVLLEGSIEVKHALG